ncbi:diacylglycerol/lipid kinase family protein [Consotaella salsifontis]|uniref:Diacylglycerol kinase family enzyme n=1 Tax=Consotaella salsifontis TaxID=1365950 RepID=A0A1T4NTQ4_9HYPH|nr:diacylglycerol kinase family protein [Consotaella salsifontis]SJZ82624.1 Diacylglycerol kinase family enzyme [Consotaella salsifontis]
MRIHVILNRHGGTLKTANLDELSGFIGDEFALHGHALTLETPEKEELAKAIEAASQRADIDVLLVGGGDGTVSGAAAALTGKSIALGVLPAGTMNLFARALQIPLDLNEAVRLLAAGRITDVDIATANGRPFVHQFAVGLHARIVRIRDRLNYASRYGKILASMRAMWMVLQRLPMMELEMEIDGTVRRIKTPGVAVSNNIYGEGHVPYADDPRGGVLGVYICKSRDPRRVGRLIVDIMLGIWRSNASLEVRSAHNVTIDISGHKGLRAVIDGELTALEPRTFVEIHPRKLRVLVPAEAAFESDKTETTTASQVPQ